MTSDQQDGAPDLAKALEVIRGTTRSWEQDPRPYAEMDEEALRSILVGSLNGSFLGRATAESFNGRGKTDILLRKGSDNVLVGECKFYNGPNKLVEAVEQLLGYRVWQDNEVCLFVFVRSAAITAAVKSVRTAADRSPHIDRVESLDSRGAETMLHGHDPDDPDLPVTVRCLLVHLKLPRTPKPKGKRLPGKVKPRHPDDVAEMLLDLKRSIPKNQGIAYTPTLDPESVTGGPLRGWSTTWSRITPEGGVGIHAAPLTDQARDEHGPEGALVAPDDGSARRMHSALRRTQRDLVPAEIRGVGIRLDTVVAALRDPADRLTRTHPDNVKITYQPRGLWQCMVTTENGGEPLSVPMAFLPRDQPATGWDLTVRGTLYDVALTISMRTSSREMAIGWELQRRRQGWPSERLAALRFLHALRRGGRLLVESIEPAFGDGDFTLAAEPYDEAIDWELELWTHVVAIEERTGRGLPIPEVVSEAHDWVKAVFTAGTALRSGTASMHVDPGVLYLRQCEDPPSVGDVTTLPMEVPVTVPIAGVDIELGWGYADVDVRLTEVAHQADGVVINFEPITDATVEVMLAQIPVPNGGPAIEPGAPATEPEAM